VRREEASITRGLNPRGCLIVNGDDAPLLSLVSQYKGQQITFGLEAHNQLFATDLTPTAQGVHFNLNGNARRRVFMPMLGKHSACNALAAIAVARKIGLNEEAIIQSLANAHGPDMRLQLSRVSGVTVLNDAYNANPNSTRAAIETLISLPSRGRRVAVLGDMLELGDHSHSYHDEIGELAGTSKLDLLVCVGKKAKRIASSARAAGFDKARIVIYPDATAAARLGVRRLRSGDLILLKGSRSVGLEAVAKAIAQQQGRTVRRAS
jgi:UDP-N-acetylmuramoyl-tripeptide--D-alanyl-D-alanine ligase